MIIAEDLTKSYGDHMALTPTSFSIKKGEIVAIVGHNGAGKSTTMKMICGLLRPTDGTIKVLGQDMDPSNYEIKSKIGYMPEESALYEDMSAIDYLTFFSTLYGMDPSDGKRKAKQLLKKLDLQRSTKPISTYSKGMKRKVLIARSLINDPDVLVYDEPASGLDPAVARSILEHLNQLTTEGKSIVFTAHNLWHIESTANRAMIFHSGKMILDAPISMIKSNYGKPIYKAIFQDDKGKEEVVEKENLKEFKMTLNLQSQKKSLISLETVKPSLEAVYLDLIGPQTIADAE